MAGVRDRLIHHYFGIDLEIVWEFDRLPPAWATFDLAAFSKKKRLWDYQQTALENALESLWRYCEDFGDYQPGEGEAVNLERRARLSRD